MIKPVRLVDEARDELLAEGAKYGMGVHPSGARSVQADRPVPRGVGRVSQTARFRRYVMKRYPFVIVYRELAKEIRVLAVAAAKRRPGYWRRRG
jgi:hypothetical protein